MRFNISSPKQVGEVLFDKMEIPYRWKKTKTGHYSTDEKKLTELAKDHDFVNQILQFRSLAKLKSTYVDALPKMVNKKTGRLHSSFNQALTATLTFLLLFHNAQFGRFCAEMRELSKFEFILDVIRYRVRNYELSVELKTYGVLCLRTQQYNVGIICPVCSSLRVSRNQHWWQVVISERYW